MKASRLIILYLALALLTLIKTNAQQPDFLFEKPYPYPIIHTLPSQQPYNYSLAVTTNDGADECYFVSVCEYKSMLFYEEDSIAFMPIIYKISHEGEVLGEFALGDKNHFTMVERLFEAPNDSDCFFALGKTHNNNEHYDKPLLAKFDHDLNLLWQREVDLPEKFHKYFNGIGTMMDSQGDILCVTSPVELLPNGNTAPSDIHLLYFRLSAEAELLAIREYPFFSPPMWLDHGELFEYQDGSGDYGQIIHLRDSTQVIPYLTRLNRNLDTINRMVIPQTFQDYEPYYQSILFSFGYFSQSLSFPNGIVVLGSNGGMIRQDAQYNITQDEVITWMSLNTENNVTNYWTLGEGEMGQGNDSIKAFPYGKGTSVIDDQTFYSCHMVGQPHGTGVDWINCFAVTKMDYNGNIIWQRYWNNYYPQLNMKVYWPNAIITTPDKGCLVTGYCYHSGQQDPATFLLKIFTDGSLAIPTTECLLRPYLCYPNPTKDQLHLQYSPDVKPSKIEIYDLQGRIVQATHTNLNCINMANLISGTYTMHITLEDGNVFSDKIMKE